MHLLLEAHQCDSKLKLITMTNGDCKHFIKKQTICLVSNNPNIKAHVDVQLSIIPQHLYCICVHLQVEETCCPVSRIFVCCILLMLILSVTQRFFFFIGIGLLIDQDLFSSKLSICFLTQSICILSIFPQSLLSQLFIGLYSLLLFLQQCLLKEVKVTCQVYILRNSVE